jgi:hypothetical protein
MKSVWIYLDVRDAKGSGLVFQIGRAIVFIAEPCLVGSTFDNEYPGLTVVVWEGTRRWEKFVT